MGYNTGYFGLDITENINGETKRLDVGLEAEICKRLAKIFFDDDSDIYGDWMTLCDECTSCGVREYDFIDTLLNISMEYPNVYFDFEAKGEDWDDHYVARINNNRIGTGYAVLPNVEELELI